MMVMNRAGIDAQAPQQPDGKYHFSYSKEFWFLIFTFLVFVFRAKIERKVRHRITRGLIGPGGDRCM